MIQETNFDKNRAYLRDCMNDVIEQLKQIKKIIKYSDLEEEESYYLNEISEYITQWDRDTDRLRLDLFRYIGDILQAKKALKIADEIRIQCEALPTRVQPPRAVKNSTK